MNIKIYSRLIIPAQQFDMKGKQQIFFNMEDVKELYVFVWKGTKEDLKINDVEDLTILEKIFDYFNDDKSEFTLGLVQSLSTGDVVALDDSYYVCQTLDWWKLNEKEITAFQELEFYKETAKV